MSVPAPPHSAVSHRALVLLSGADATDLLQGLITTDLAQLKQGEALPGALLTPQGKILFDFLVTRDDETIRLDTAQDQADALLKRLTMYKLRAAVTLAVDKDPVVTISPDGDAGGYRDMRFAKAGETLFRAYGGAAPVATDSTHYDRARIAAGIVDSGSDFALQDAFPHDILLDKNGGLSFRKGCYVGQEVVSRMQHRGTARRRVVTVSAAENLPETGTALTVNGRPIGTLGTVLGSDALAIVRIDKAGEAIAKGEPVLAGDVAVTLTLPAWTDLSFPAESDEASA